MGFRSSALYQCLRTDISNHLAEDQILGVESGVYAEGWPGMSPSEFACVQLLQSVNKKFVDEIAADAETRALEKFLAVNASCAKWTLDFKDTWDEILFGTFKSVLDNFFFPNGDPLVTSFEQMLDHGRTGPGSSIAAYGTDFYTKLFSGPLSATSVTLYDVYKRYVHAYPTWRDAELLRSAMFGEVRVVAGNRVSFVPKSNEISRTICTEPSLNMFYQLGLEQILLRRLNAFFGIDLADQQFRNRELARVGSQSDGLSTIDLSSASDSISLKMLESCMPRYQLAWLMAIRCPRSTLPTGDDVDLNMISTMGNGTTFALQCVIFSSVVMACFRCRDLSPIRNSGAITGNWGVNGDDIIVPREITADVLRLLKLLGFQVNASKTFVEGPFRESCGGDFFMGHSVRGVYLKSLNTQEERYVAINLFNSWTLTTGIKLPATVQYLLKTVEYQPVPRWDNADSGIRVPYRLAFQQLSRSDHGTLLYRRSEAQTKRYLLGLAPKGYTVPDGERTRAHNPWGLLLAFVQGSIVSGSLSVRQDRLRYRAKQAIAPNWDYAPPEVLMQIAEESALPALRGRLRELPENLPLYADVTAFHNAVLSNHCS